MSRNALAGFAAGFIAVAIIAAVGVVLASRFSGLPGAPVIDEVAAARGSQLYQTHCERCHGDRHGAGGLADVPSHGPDGHTWHHSDRNLREIILDGPGDMAEMMREMMGVPADAPRMPAWRGTLTDGDVDAVLAYIKTFWTPEQQRLQREMPMMP